MYSQEEIVSQLKECPFCGNTDLSVGQAFIGGNNSISCSRCHYSYYSHFANWDDTIIYWNRRKYEKAD